VSSLLGRIEPRFPSPGTEKEFAQVVGRADTAGLTDHQTLHTVLSSRENRYLARQLCWVFTVEAMETYILMPRDTVDIDALIASLRPACPTTDDHTYNNWVKAELANAQADASNIATVIGLGGGFCSTVAALGCGPLEPGLLALAVAWQIASNEFGRKLANDPPGIDFTLPPVSNFTVIAQPGTKTLTLLTRV
jgi:hypothetical protein